MKTTFFICPICGNIITKIADSGVIPACCGKPMQQMAAKQHDDTASEKHVPIIHREDECTLRVEIGSLPHPMTDDHHIVFAYLETEHGGQLQYLCQENGPIIEFCGCKDQPTAVYVYCNIHGLWVTTEIPKQKAHYCCMNGK